MSTLQERSDAYSNAGLTAGCAERKPVGYSGSANTCSTEPDPGGRCMVSGNAMRAFRHEMLQPGPDGMATYWRPSTA